MYGKPSISKMSDVITVLFTAPLEIFVLKWLNEKNVLFFTFDLPSECILIENYNLILTVTDFLSSLWTLVCPSCSGGQLSPVSSFKVTEGGVASLSCQYSVKRFGLSRVCWGRSCGTFWCNNILVQTDENGIVSKVGLAYKHSCIYI